MLLTPEMFDNEMGVNWVVMRFAMFVFAATTGASVLSEVLKPILC
jgi:hypothetical protein